MFVMVSAVGHDDIHLGLTSEKIGTERESSVAVADCDSVHPWQQAHYTASPQMPCMCLLISTMEVFSVYLCHN